MKISPVLPSGSSIGSIGSIDSLKTDATKLDNHQVLNSASFQNVLNRTLNQINGEQLEAYDAMSGIATGRVENLQRAVQQIEEAELSLKLALEVKNKALAGAKQIMQMQI